MSPSIRQLDGPTSKSLQASLAYPTLTSIVLALVHRSMKTRLASRIEVHIDLHPEWHISCADDAEVCENAGVWDGFADSRLGLLSHLGVVDIQEGLWKHVQSADDAILSGKIDENVEDCRDRSRLACRVSLRDVYRQIPVRRRLLSHNSAARSELERCRKAVAVACTASPHVRVCLKTTALGRRANEVILLEAPKAASITARYEQLFALPVTDAGFACAVTTSCLIDGVPVTIDGFMIRSLLRSKAHQHVLVNGVAEDHSPDAIPSWHALVKNVVVDFLHRSSSTSMGRTRRHRKESGKDRRSFGFYISVNMEKAGESEEALRAVTKGVAESELRMALEAALQGGTITFDQQDSFEEDLISSESPTKRKKTQLVSTTPPESRSLASAEGFSTGQTFGTTNFPSPTPMLEEEPMLPSSLINHADENNGDLEGGNEVHCSCTLQKSSLEASRVIGQVDGKYICLAYEEAYLVLLDQHAAHERVRLEAMLSEYMDACLNGLSASPLQKGCIVRISAESLTAISDALQKTRVQARLRFWGFDFHFVSESEGNKALLCLDAIPAMLQERLMGTGQTLGTFVEALADCLSEGEGDLDWMTKEFPVRTEGRTAAWISALRHIPAPILGLFHSIACRGAIMFNDALTSTQCKTLLSQIGMHCSETIGAGLCPRFRLPTTTQQIKPTERRPLARLLTAHLHDVQM